ncbi:MAG: winged helix-turn-helix domain-containing protein [Acidobacteria bacterium]|nr:winged helix-turn-helix domain-containing protein [Acidobacteriota bacterium]
MINNNNDSSNSDNDMLDKSNSSKENTANKVTKMPEDFRHLVHQQRARAQALMEKRRKQAYQTFITEEVESGKRIPMPKDFWKAVEGEISFDEISKEDFNFNLEKTSVSDKVAEKQNPATLPLWNKEENIDLIVEEKLEVSKKETESNKEENEIIYLDPDSIGLSFREAAQLILSREKRVMTAREIATIAINEGLVSSAGKTPDASIAGQIYTDTRRNPEKTPFVIVGPRTYALKEFCEQENLWKKLVKSQDIENNVVITGNFSTPSTNLVELTKLDEQLAASSQATLADKIDSNIVSDEDNIKITELTNIEIVDEIINKENVLDSNIEIEQLNLSNNLSIEVIEEESNIVSKENKRMGYKQAAIYLLQQMQRPMTAKEIVTIAIEQGLIDSNSKKPDASLAGQIYTEIQKLGEQSIFRMVAPRTYGLAEWYKHED